MGFGTGTDWITPTFPVKPKPTVADDIQSFPRRGGH